MSYTIRLLICSWHGHDYRGIGYLGYGCIRCGFQEDTTQESLRLIAMWAEQALDNGPPELGLILDEARRALKVEK